MSELRRSQRNAARMGAAAPAAAAGVEAGVAPEGEAAAAAAGVAAGVAARAPSAKRKKTTEKKKKKTGEEERKTKEQERMRQLEQLAEKEKEAKKLAAEAEQLRKNIERSYEEEEEEEIEEEAEEIEEPGRRERQRGAAAAAAASWETERELSRMRERIKELESRSREGNVIPLHKVATVSFKGVVLGKELDDWMRFIKFQIHKYKSDLSSDVAKINYATSMFSEQAILWWTESGAMERVKTWSQFVEAMEARFRPANITTESLFSFQDLRQGDKQSVAEYITSFSSATATLKPDQVTDLMKIVQFIKGLRPTLHTKVMEEYRLGKFSMEEVQQLAIHKELTMRASLHSSSSYHHSSSSSIHALSLADHEEGGEEDSFEIEGMSIPRSELLNFMQQRSGGGGRYHGGRPGQGRGGYAAAGGSRPPHSQGRAKPSREEQERRRREGLCYYCGKTSSHISRECPERNRRGGTSTPPSYSSSSSSSSSHTQSKK